MSLALATAKTEIARVTGSQGDSVRLALAATALRATARAWTNRHDWKFLLKDNANTVTLICNLANTAVTVTSTAGLNVGQTVTGSGIPANTTISAISSVTAFTVTATGVTNAAIALTFGAYIPVIAGTSYYYLPSDYRSLYTARLLTTKRWLEVVRPREVDRKVADQESQTDTVAITEASPGSGSGFTAADQRPRARLIGVPGTTESLLVKYYRGIDGEVDPLDVPDGYLDAYVDYAKVWFLKHLNSNDPRIDILAGLAERQLLDAIRDDSEIQDEQVRMKSQFEMMNSPFSQRGYPDYD